jgi:hypothetical protein
VDEVEEAAVALAVPHAVKPHTSSKIRSKMWGPMRGPARLTSKSAKVLNLRNVGLDWRRAIDAPALRHIQSTVERDLDG